MKPRTRRDNLTTNRSLLYNASRKGDRSFVEDVATVRDPKRASLQQEYINSLQEEIKYLQAQLKLLKDQEIVNREGVNEYDNFLKDEVPLNENILAIKTKYNKTKQTLQVESKNKFQKNKIERIVNGSLKKEIKTLKDSLVQLFVARGATFAEANDLTRKLLAQTHVVRERTRELTDETKQLNNRAKSSTMTINELNRTKEKQKITEERLEDQAKDEAVRNAATLGESLERLGQAFVSDRRVKEEPQNPLVKQAEEKVSALKKSILIVEKKKGTCNNKIAEVQLELDELGKEREKLRIQMAEAQRQKKVCADRVFQLQKYSDQLVRDKVGEIEAGMIKKEQVKEKYLRREVERLQDRIAQLEGSSASIINERKNETNLIVEFSERVAENSKELKQLRQTIVQKESEMSSYSTANERLKLQIERANNEKENALIKESSLVGTIEERRVSLQTLSKKLQLMKQLRNISLEEMKLVKQGGTSIGGRLVKFMDKWTALNQRTTS